MILLVVDTQKGCFNEKLYAFETVRKNIKQLITTAREKNIIVIGVSTDYCMDATIKSGFEKGFNLYVPAYTNSTYDNPYFDKETAYKYFNEFMWGRRYAKIITVEEANGMMK